MEGERQHHKAKPDTRKMHRAHPTHPFSVYSATERLKRFAPPCTKSCTRGCRCQHKQSPGRHVHAGFLRGEFHKVSGDYRIYWEFRKLSKETIIQYVLIQNIILIRIIPNTSGVFNCPTLLPTHAGTRGAPVLRWQNHRPVRECGDRPTDFCTSTVPQNPSAVRLHWKAGYCT